MKKIGLETEALASLLVADARTVSGLTACTHAVRKGYTLLTHAAEFREMEKWFTLVGRGGKKADGVWALLDDVWDPSDPVTSVVRTFLSHEAMRALNLFGQIGWNALARRALFSLDTVRIGMSAADARVAFEGKSERFAQMIAAAVRDGNYEIRVDRLFGYHRAPAMIRRKFQSEGISSFTLEVLPDTEAQEAVGKSHRTPDSLHDHLFWSEVARGLVCYVSNDKTFDYCRCDRCRSLERSHLPVLKGLSRKIRAPWEAIEQLPVA
jgi:hypothetical protein